MVTLTLKGVQGMTANIKGASKEIRQAAKSALFVEGNIEMTESKKRCPVAPDGGTLRGSGQVSEPQETQRRIWVTLSYGGAASAYAIAVHEHLSVHSPPSWKIAELEGDGVKWHTPGTGPKFLESVLNESEKFFLQRVAGRMQQAMGSK